MTRLGKGAAILTTAFVILFLASATWFNTDHGDHTKNGLFNVQTVSYGRSADLMWGLTWVVAILAIITVLCVIARLIQQKRTTTR